MRFFVLLILLCTGCNKAEEGACLTSTGDMVTATVYPGEVSAITLRDNVNLEVVPGVSGCYAEITGGENLVPGVRLENSNGLLTISNNNKCNWLRSYRHPIRVRIYLDTLTTLNYLGTGSVTFVKPNEADTFYYNQDGGHGNVRLDVVAGSTFIVMHTGTGDVELKGHAKFLYSYSLAQGSVDARGCEAAWAFCVNGSMGDFFVNARDSVTAQLLNFGNVYVPDSVPVNASIKGSGRVITY